MADVCVLEEDLSRVDPHDFAAVPVAATILDGRVVYERASASGPRRTPFRSSITLEHGRACYRRGACCCTLSQAIRAGRAKKRDGSSTVSSGSAA